MIKTLTPFILVVVIGLSFLITAESYARGNIITYGSVCNTEILEGVHPDLKEVVFRARDITTTNFCVIEGIRSKKRQGLLFRSGASKTLNSRHLTGHAVDIVAYDNTGVSWDWTLYYKIALAMKQASKELGIPIDWGGDWTWRDGPHFQLNRRIYP